MKTPDFTPPAIAAFVILVITNIAILWGIDIGAQREAALTAIVNALAIVAFLLHDAIVRHGRSRIAAAEIASKAAETIAAAPATTVVTNLNP